MAGSNIIHFEPHGAEDGFLEFPGLSTFTGYRSQIFGIVPAGFLVGKDRTIKFTENHFTTELLPWSEMASVEIKRVYSRWRIAGGLIALGLSAWLLYIAIWGNVGANFNMYKTFIITLVVAAVMLLGIVCSRIVVHTKPGADGKPRVVSWTSPPLKYRKTRAHCAVALRYAKAAGVPVTSHIDDDGAELPPPAPKTG